jgi:DNA-binding transcriptional LysR family regulator
MDIRLFESFRAVVEHGSATAAARLMGLTQPAVSAQIARLEEEVGFPLFERFGNRLRLTPEGQAFHTEVELSLRTFAGLSRTAKLIKEGVAGTLVVAAHPSSGISLLPPVLARFARERPEARLELYTRNSEVVRELFPSRNYDLGVVEASIDPTGLTVQHYRMECVVVLPKNHPLSAHEIITPKLLSGMPFVAISRQRNTHHQVMNVFAAHSATCKVVAEAEFFASVCGMVAHGLGVSIVDPATAEEFSMLGLVVRPFAPAIQYRIAVFHSADRRPSILAREFLAALDARILSLPRSSKV